MVNKTKYNGIFFTGYRGILGGYWLMINFSGPLPFQVSVTIRRDPKISKLSII